MMSTEDGHLYNTMQHKQNIKPPESTHRFIGYPQYHSTYGVHRLLMCSAR